MSSPPPPPPSLMTPMTSKIVHPHFKLVSLQPQLV